MAKVITDNQHYKDIADAIRAKTESGDSYKPSEMADAIMAIEGGGELGELEPGFVTPTGQEFTAYPDGAGFSSVTVAGDVNLEPQNIAMGVTIYGVEGTLKIGSSTGDVPAAYQPYLEEALNYYGGEYEDLMILESTNMMGFGFMQSGFAIESYNSGSSEFTASGWVYVRCNKTTGAWAMQDWSYVTSEGQNYVNHIRYCSSVLTYNGTQIYPVGGDGGSSGGGVKQSEVYDMMHNPAKTKTVYTVPRDGTMFVVSKYSCESFGFETQVRKTHRTLRGSSFVDVVQSVYVSKKNVSVGETITLPSSSGHALVILTELGSNVVECTTWNCDFTKGTEPPSNIEIVGADTIKGFCYLSLTTSSESFALYLENNALSDFEFVPCKTSNIAWGMPGYATGICDRIAYSVTNMPDLTNGSSHEFVVFKLSTEGTPVYDIDPIETEFDVLATWDFVTTERELTVPSAGYVVFTGSYRQPDGFPFNGFTVVKEVTRIIGSTEQTEVIAYKAVTENEMFYCNTSKRFGGTFYITNADLSHANVFAGNATRENGNIVYPMPDKHDTMFGVSGCIYTDDAVSSANVNDIYVSKDAATRRLTTFYANGFTRLSGESNISFPFTDGDYENDVQGIWAKFTFAE